MKKSIILLLIAVTSCKQVVIKKEFIATKFKPDLIISFGSCNNQRIQNVLFDEISKNKPKVFIWGGDVIYSDTDNPLILANNYEKFKQDTVYQNFKKHVKIIGTWDDHDYGINDGGFDNPIKDEAKHLFLDFLDVSKNDVRREQEGVYSSMTIKKDSNSVKVILLDTRYFRTELTKDPTGKKRYIPNKYGKGTLLGDKQWKWLENELRTSKADFTILVSSIQFLSTKHGFESWGNMPHEMDKLKDIILKTNTKNVLILSGDRHIAEISKTNIGMYKYPLLDFTSSGLTHAYTSFSGEENPFRVSEVIHQINFGLVKFDFTSNRVLFEIRGENNALLEQFVQQY